MSAIAIVLAMAVGVALGLLGGGGSILAVPLLVYGFGLEAKPAIATSLLIVAVASLAAGVGHWRADHVRLREGCVFGTAGMLGAYAGGRASELVDGRLLLVLLALVMIGAAGAMWRGRGDTTRPVARTGAVRWPFLLQGFVVGLFTGLVGAGGGFLIVPALVLWAGMPMQAAVGTSLMIITLQSVAAFLGYAAHVSIDPSVLIVASSAAVSGAWLGSRLVRRVPVELLRRGFASFLVAMAIFVLVREGSVLVEIIPRALRENLAGVLISIGLASLALVGFVMLRGRGGFASSRPVAEGGGVDRIGEGRESWIS